MKKKATPFKTFERGKQVTKWKDEQGRVYDIKPVLDLVEREEGECPYCASEVEADSVLCPYCRADLTNTSLTPIEDNRLRSPFPWFGTKRKVAQDCWRLLQKPNRYIEPFLGSAALLLTRPPGVNCVVNDLNRYLANFWRATQFAPDKVAELVDYPVNEADLESRHAWLRAQPLEQAMEPEDDILKRLKALEEGLYSDPLWFDPKIAAWWCWGQSCWIGKGWCDGERMPTKRPKANSNSGVLRTRKPVTSKKQLPLTGAIAGVKSKKIPSLQDYFRELQAKLKEVIVCCGNWERVVTPAVLALKKGKTTAVFLDPPYKDYGKVYSGVDPVIYKRVWGWCKEHEQDQRLKIMLCGYDGEHELPGWSVYSWNAGRGMAKDDSRGRLERIWCSPSIQPRQDLDCLTLTK